MIGRIVHTNRPSPRPGGDVVPNVMSKGLARPVLARAVGVTLVTMLMAPVGVAETEPVLGAPAAFAFEPGAEETLRVDAGTPIHQSAAARAPVLRRVDSVAELPLLDRQGHWAHIRYDDLTGWVWTGDAHESTARTGLDDGGTTSGGPPLPSPIGAPMLPPPALRPVAVDEAQVRDVVGLLGPSRQTRRAGPYELWTDIRIAGRAERVAAVLADVDRAFADRHGIEPPPPEREVVIAFADPDGYRAATKRVTQLDGVSSRGHTRGGIATLIATGPRRHVDAILIHEATHLIVRRTLGGNLPTWLEEGLAEDLAYAHVDAEGRIDVDRVGRFTKQREALIHGGLAAIQERRVGYAAGLDTIREEALRNAAPSLSELLHLEFDTFVRSDQRATHYAMAAHLVRYLLDGDDPVLRSGLRRYLQQVATGASADAEALLAALGRDWDALQRGFEAHLSVRLSR